jgi:hypothetical protein
MIKDTVQVTAATYLSRGFLTNWVLRLGKDLRSTGGMNLDALREGMLMLSRSREYPWNSS